MPFERFTRVGGSHRPRVSITKQGLISFNQGAHRRFQLADYAYAVLFWDKEQSMVGVMLTNDDTEDGAAKFRHRQSGADIAGKSFLEYHNIDYTHQTTRYDPELSDHDGQPIIVFRVTTRSDDARNQPTRESVSSDEGR